MITTSFTSPYAGTSFGEPETYALTASFTSGADPIIVRVKSTFTSDDAFGDIHDALLDAAYDEARCHFPDEDYEMIEDSGPQETR